MSETKGVIIVSVILFVLAGVAFYLGLVLTGFNFYRAELNIDGNNVSEKLFYNTDSEYHTLYRNFESPVEIERSGVLGLENIVIDDVRCSDGEPYVRNSDCYIYPDRSIRNGCPYTEPNEYGCTFGDVYGFEKGVEYVIGSDYEISGSSVFFVDGKYYTKFVAYSGERHKLLTRDNFFVRGDGVELRSYYLPGDDVFVYVPFDGEVGGREVIELSEFEYDGSLFFMVILHLFPLLFFLGLYFIFGRELINPLVPEYVSNYPKERKAWEVAAFFNPPFARVNPDLFSAMMIDFHRRNIISTKVVGKDVFIRLNKADGLDSVEKMFYKMLKSIEDNCSDDYRDGEYFNLKKASGSVKVMFYSDLKSQAQAVQKKIKKEGKKYLSNTAVYSISIFAFLAYMVFIASIEVGIDILFLTLLYFFSSVILQVVNYNTSILMRFKGEYYEEYLQWQGFKGHFPKYSTLKTMGHKGTILWGPHMVYAAALGVAKKALKEMESHGMISKKDYVIFASMNNVGSSVAGSSGVSGSGGVGGGGVGGGGVGGGGGGGR